MLHDRITESRGTSPYGRDLPGPIEVEDISEESLRRRHEVQDVALRPILRFLLILVISAVIIHLVLWWGLRAWTKEDLRLQPQVPPANVTPQPMLGPGVAPFSAIQLQTRANEQQARLESYGWVDREAGAVHIPIEQAMQLLVARGLPARDDAPAPTFGLSQAYELESEGGQISLPGNTAGIGEEVEGGTADDEASNGGE